MGSGDVLTHFFINPLDVVMETGTRAVPLEPVPALVLDKFWMDFLDLSKDQAIVHTTLRRIEEISWKLPEIAVTLHRRKETDDKDNNSINIKILRL